MKEKMYGPLLGVKKYTIEPIERDEEVFIDISFARLIGVYDTKELDVLFMGYLNNKPYKVFREKGTGLQYFTDGNYYIIIPSSEKEISNTEYHSKVITSSIVKEEIVQPGYHSYETYSGDKIKTETEWYQSFATKNDSVRRLRKELLDRLPLDSKYQELKHNITSTKSFMTSKSVNINDKKQELNLNVFLYWLTDPKVNPHQKPFAMSGNIFYKKGEQPVLFDFDYVLVNGKYENLSTNHSIGSIENFEHILAETSISLDPSKDFITSYLGKLVEVPVVKSLRHMINLRDYLSTVHSSLSIENGTLIHEGVVVRVNNYNLGTKKVIEDENTRLLG
jgi:hypothetical protein